MDDYCSQVSQVFLVYYVSACVLLLLLIKQVIYEHGDTWLVLALKNETVM